MESRPGAAKFELWSFGFRPFFLLAGAYGALSVLAWISVLVGWLAGGLWAGAFTLFTVSYFRVLTGPPSA